MIKINAYNLLYDFRDFLKENIGKFTIIALINIAAIALGIRSGFAVYDAESYLITHQTNEFLLITAERGIFAYFFINLITYLILFSLLALLSAHFLLSYLCFAILFFQTYYFAMYLSLYIAMLKLSVLPFILCCLLPCFLLCTFILATVAVMTLNRANDLRCYGCGRSNCFPVYMQRLLLPCITLSITLILFAIPSYFLTIGIIL